MFLNGLRSLYCRGASSVELTSKLQYRDTRPRTLQCGSHVKFNPVANMVVFALLIINKAGGLIYNRTFSPGLQKLDSNDYLILAGTFHGIHAISRNISPVPPVAPPPLLPTTSSSTITPSGGGPGGPGAGGDKERADLNRTSSSIAAQASRQPSSTGIQSLESSHFRLTCFQTPTGVKFLLFTSPEQPNTETVARRCYEIYAQFVMGNPFYSLEMPVRVEKFDRALGGYLVRP